jgi:serine/threonine protein kinase/TPR repeat protein
LKTYKPGEVILGKYKVTRILGQGGMGQVLAAHRPGLNDTVALKFLLASVHDKPEIAARFAREARTAIRIENEHVCRVYDVGEVEGVPFIVMEHLEGEDLDAILARGGLSAQESADLLLQACEAIHEAHVVHAIVHRDLKPGNLFVKTRLDGRPFLKVLDFGIAKSSAAGDMSATASTTVLGSPLYMSPEQLLTPKNVDARSDVWALGVILYEMLTGAPPFTGDTQPAVMAAILKGSYAKATTLRPDIPADLEQLLAETLVVDPGARLPSVEAFAARLAPFGTGAAATSHDHIQRLSRSLPSSRSVPPVDSVTPPPTEVSAPKGAGRVTEDTTALAVPQSTPDQAARTKASTARWRAAALGIAVAGVGAVVAVPRMRHAGGPSDVGPAPSAVASSVDTVQADAAAPAASGTPGEATAQRDTVPGDPPASTTVAAPPRDNVGTTAHPNTTGSTSAEASRTPGTLSPVASVGACAAGATAACEAACTAKQPGSCMKLAQALEKGTGASKDIKRAASLYEEACTAGTAVACNDVGVLYARGDGVTKDAARAIGLYRRGCDLHDGTACVNLGAMHYLGDGVDKDEKLGVHFFDQGCDAGQSAGCLNVSIAYGKGVGVPKNAVQSFTYAESACKGGASGGCVRMALAKLAGDGVTKDVTGALTQLETTCARPDATACEDLAQLYMNGAGSDVTVDPLLAAKFARKACALHSKVGCEIENHLQNKDIASSDNARAIALFQTKCAAGDSSSCGLLGEELLKRGVVGDREAGLAALKKGCDGGVDRACQKVGEVGGR